MEWKTTFHQRINELWERAKDRDYRITQGVYAERIGTSRASLRGWIDGKGEPNSEGFVRIANVEKVSLEWLLGYNERPAKNKEEEPNFMQKYDAISKNGKAIVNATLQEIWRQENDTYT